MNFLPGVREGVVRGPRARATSYDSTDPDDPRTPVVLLHGTGGTATSHFWALFPMLAEHHRVLALDFTDPAPADGDADTTWYVEQVEALVAELSPNRRVAVVGYSFGAVVAAAFAGRRQDLVESLVLVAGWTRTDPQQQLRNEIWSRLHAEGSSALAEFMVFTAYSPAYLLARTAPELAGLVANAGAGRDRAVMMRFNRTVDISEDVAAIAAPTLVVGCTADQMVPPHHARLLFGGIRDARYAEVRSGHAVVHERPAELYHLIDPFLTDPARTTPGDVILQEAV
ncbi:alpha/beta fold hydrolase [Mumia sp. DW29H23]|uniref:alpha/beta fold hydrolase n=1 Tax=Mumia sp. DW29H23 TaxID=3421241 RepID=UPI003D6963CF